MTILIRWIVYALAILVASYVVPNVTIDGFSSALIAAIILGFANSFIKPLLIIITLPINLFTFGLFTLVINALLVLLVSATSIGFVVSGFWAAFVFSIIVSIILYLVQLIFS